MKDCPAWPLTQPRGERGTERHGYGRYDHVRRDCKVAADAVAIATDAVALDLMVRDAMAAAREALATATDALASDAQASVDRFKNAKTVTTGLLRITYEQPRYVCHHGRNVRCVCNVHSVHSRLWHP